MSKKKSLQYFAHINDLQLFDRSDSMCPCRMIGFQGGKKTFSNISSSFYVVVLEGTIDVKYKSNEFDSLPALAFAACPGEVSISGKGRAIIIEKFGYRVPFQIGLIEETRGRLVYIDNASSSLLVSPARMGDPCLNFLTFPPNITQTAHIHPTVRLGAVLWGSGECLWGEEKLKVPLTAGTTFCLPETQIHSFNSYKDGLAVVAFHPDSDVGPTDFSHPMLSRTYIVKK